MEDPKIGFTAESVRSQFTILAVTWWIGYPLSLIADFLPQRDCVLAIIHERLHRLQPEDVSS